MAPLIPILASTLASKGAGASAAIKNDLAVVRWTHKGRKRGTGKRKHITPDRDVELHVNPASLTIAAVGVGAAAVGIGLFLWIAGLGLTRDTAATKSYIVRPVGDKYRIYDSHGVMVRQPLDHEPGDIEILTRAQSAQGWYLTGSEPRSDCRIYHATNDGKYKFAVAHRDRFTLGGIKLF